MKVVNGSRFVRKPVPTLYESDERRYVAAHRWQVHGWARLARRLMWPRAYGRWIERSFSRVHVTGVEHLDQLDGPAVFVANHQSHADNLLVHAALPEPVRERLYFGAAQDRWFVRGRKKLVLQPWYQSLALGNFPILRGGGARALDHAHWLLARGQHVFLFPEGTRATGEGLGEFKHGATVLAMLNAVPVVPIYLGGLRDIRPKGSRSTTRGPAWADILEPVRLPADGNVPEATALLRQRLNAAHLRHRQRLRAEFPEAA